MNPIMTVCRTTSYGHPDAPPWRTVWMWCPGCDHAKGIPVPGEDGALPPEGPHWEWNGSLTSPSLTPSILQHASGRMPQCHSYLTDGQWQFLSDCTHELASQTVPMVPLPDWLYAEAD
jgi:hypothetical protein